VSDALLLATILTGVVELRAEVTKQHDEILRRLDAILGALSPPPASPDLNPLGGLMAASGRRTEQLLADLQAALNRKTGTGPAAVLLFPSREEGAGARASEQRQETCPPWPS
jgi:hypothetical protein